MGAAFASVGWTSTSCGSDASGRFVCTATANQKGGIGVVSPWASDSGFYATSGSNLTVDDSVDYSYCASADVLTLIPKDTILPLKGTIVLKKAMALTGSP